MWRHVLPKFSNASDVKHLETAPKFSSVVQGGGHQSSVMVVAVVKRGVTPLPHTMLGVTVPDHRIAADPPPLFPVEKYVAVPDPAVPAAKSMFEAGLTELPVTVHPPDVLAGPARRA